ncbi:unnamed protein product, partial [Vitis vinifera]
MAFVGEAVLTAFIETLFDKLASSELLQFAGLEHQAAGLLSQLVIKGLYQPSELAQPIPSRSYPMMSACLLFAQRALVTRNFDTHPHLRVVGEEIVKKCKGLPLAAKALGGMLRKLNHDAWEDILKSKIWDLPEENNTILPALKLSYHRLPFHLKRCFVYCSIFPKNYHFKVDKLVLLWMGEGFLPHAKRQKQMEEIGSEYFYELLARSFFLQSNRNSSQFVMHDLVQDLAQFVAGDNLRTLVALPINIQFSWERSYIAMKVLHGLLMGMRCLRVLSLAGYYISELPDSFGENKHLRYLNFSNCSIKRLPDSMGCLYNLQTLILCDCGELTRLPMGIGMLINLRHFVITGASKLKEIPFQIGNLTNLQILPRFIVSKTGGSGIGELKNCSNLQGVLSIFGLHEIMSVKDARDANLKDKQKIEELIMNWTNDCWDSRNDVDELHVLESLQPHKNLEKLTIAFYGGSKFPSWIGDVSSKMVELTLKICKKCMSVPSLGGLSLLEVLCIQGMGKVKSIGAEFYGECMNPFASLKELRFEDMPKWESWSHSNSIKEDVGAFPCLKRFLDVSECPELVCGLPKLASLHELNLQECDEAMLRGDEVDLRSLATLELKKISRLNCLRIGLTGSLVALERLVIGDCGGLTCLWEEQGLACNLKSLLRFLEVYNCEESLPEGMIHRNSTLSTNTCLEKLTIPVGELPSTLKHLEIWGCRNLKSMSEKMWPSNTDLEYLELQGCPNLRTLPKCLNSLKVLYIVDCEGLECFPARGLTTPNLTRLEIGRCENLKSLPQQMRNLKSLQQLKIYQCPRVESFPEEECLLPTSLTNLDISRMRSLASLALQNLISLQSLHISYCRKLCSLGLLPATLGRLEIRNCPILKERFLKDKGEYWSNIAHIPCIKLDGEYIH